jgi:hypothetical protein
MSVWAQIALSLQAAAPEPKTAMEWLQRASDQMNLRMPGSAPFHMKVSFHAFPGEEVLGPKEKPQIQTGDGVYEETWLAPHWWRREVTLAGYHAIEVDSKGGRKMQASSDYEPSRVLMLLTALLHPIPQELLSEDADFYPDQHWSVAQVSKGDISLVDVDSRVSASDRFTVHNSFYFLPKGLLVFAKMLGLTTSWQNDVAFAGKAVPGHVTIQGSGLKPGAPDRTLLTADVTIEPAGETDPAAFDLPGPSAEPGLTLRPLYHVDRRPQLLVSPPEWPLHHDAAIQFWGAIDRKGEIREVEIVTSEDAENLHEIVEEMRRLRYRPAEIDGSRCEMPFALNFMVENHSDLR